MVDLCLQMERSLNLTKANKPRAAIDLGTNTFHLLIGTVGPDAQISVLHQQRWAVQLGKGGLAEGRILHEAFLRAIDACQQMAAIILQHGVELSNVRAAGTSAIRNAKNGIDLVAAIQSITGIKVQILSGQQEAMGIFDGVKASGAIPTNAKTLVLDIGGGSVEFIFCHGLAARPPAFHSLEIGGQRMLERFMATDPIGRPAVEALRLWLRQELALLQPAFRAFQPTVLVGASGTFDTLRDVLAAEVGAHNTVPYSDIPLDFMATFGQQMRLANHTERLATPGMVPLRADMIVVAMVLIEEVFVLAPIAQVVGSSYALREGLLLG